MTISRQGESVIQVGKAIAALIAIGLGVISLFHHIVEGQFPKLNYYLFAELIAIAGALALLATIWRPMRLRWQAWLGIGIAGVVGSVGGTAVLDEQLACMYCYSQSRGWPFQWMHRGISFENYLAMPDARAYLESHGASWHFDVIPAVVNIFVWAGAALTVVVLVRLAIRALRRTPVRVAQPV